MPYATPIATSTCLPELERFAALVAAAEREKVAAWMMQRGYATGHGDTVEELLVELEWQVRESERKEFAKHAVEIARRAVNQEREACAELCERMAKRTDDIRSAALEMAAENIRARGNT